MSPQQRYRPTSLCLVIGSDRTMARTIRNPRANPRNTASRGWALLNLPDVGAAPLAECSSYTTTRIQEDEMYQPFTRELAAERIADLHRRAERNRLVARAPKPDR